MNIYVGNLSPKTTESQLRKAFWFVEMPFEQQAFRAIGELDGSILGGYTLSVKESGMRA